MIAVHGEKYATKAQNFVDLIMEDELSQSTPLEDRPLIFYRNKMWTRKNWIESNMSAEVPCILPI